jgi:hypothetical protein
MGCGCGQSQAKHAVTSVQAAARQTEEQAEAQRVIDEQGLNNAIANARRANTR